MHLILARHGQSFANVDSARFGHGDSPLTPLGEQQAHKLGLWLRAHQPDIDLIAASPLKRAQLTAEIINQYLHLPMKIYEGLAEMERFDLPYLDRREHPFRRETHYSLPDEDGYMEGYKARVIEVLEELTADLARPKPLLIVSHGGTSATIIRHILERHDLFIRTHNTAFHSLKWEDGRWHVLGMNLAPHLPYEMLS